MSSLGGDATATVVIENQQDVEIPNGATEEQMTALLDAIADTACGDFAEDECAATSDTRRRLRGRALATASHTVTYTLDPTADDFEVPDANIITPASLNAALADGGFDLNITSVTTATTTVLIEVTVETIADEGTVVPPLDTDAILDAVAVGIPDVDMNQEVAIATNVVDNNEYELAPTPADVATTAPTVEEDEGLSGAAIAGIVIGSIAGVAFLGLVGSAVFSGKFPKGGLPARGGKATEAGMNLVPMEGGTTDEGSDTGSVKNLV